MGLEAGRGEGAGGRLLRDQPGKKQGRTQLAGSLQRIAATLVTRGAWEKSCFFWGSMFDALGEGWAACQGGQKHPC